MVEDMETDAVLAARELKRGGLGIDSRRVEREEDFRRELSEFRPHIILSDFSMPHFDGMAALAIAREIDPDVPFIFVSGTLGEDYAIRALKNGATDYVLKNNLVRLVPAVERALSEAAARAERRRDEQLLALEHKVVLHIAGAESASDGLKAVMRAMCETEGWDLGRYLRVDERAGILRLEEFWCTPDRALEDFIENSRDLSFAPGEGLTGLAWKSKASLWSTDTTTDPRVRQSDLSRKFAMGGAFVFPVTSGGGVIGVMTFSSRRTREPDERLLRAVGIIGSQLGQFLVRQEQQRHITRLNRIYAVLSGINSAIVRVANREELFREACRIAVQAGGFKLAWVGEVDRQANRVRPVAWEGVGKDYIALMPLALREGPGEVFGLAGLAIQDRRAVVVNDMTTDPRVSLGKEAVAHGFRGLAMLPLCVTDEPVGVLALYADTVGFFDEQDEMRLLLDLAGDIVFALDHIQKAQALDYLAFYDPSTGVANRRLFLERVDQRIRIAAKRQDRLALAILDIERFKTINDTLGRHAGDALLKEFAARFAHHRDDPDRVGRIGGDQFALVIPDLRAADEAARRLDQTLKECLGSPFLAGGSELWVAAKVGIAMYPEDGADAESLSQNAEAALKKAKSAGERYLFYASHMSEKVAQRLALENKLRLAMEREEFVLHYQPKVDIESRRIASVEALIRWQSPELGLVPPMQFIPLMEETGMILEAGAWALRQAVKDHNRWIDQGIAAPRIAVNVSAIQLRRHDFVAGVAEAIRPGPVAPGIDLEITESLVMEDIEANMKKLEAVRLLGLSIAVDDFGVGYSSLGYLAKLPVDSLKIDRSFIVAMLKDPAVMTLVSMIVSLARSLHLKVVAEGVEKEEQAKALQHLGCDQFQGYLFSKPLPFTQMVALLGGTGASGSRRR
jgi:diguanylate cyclase (GGDEF)-like protein